MALAIFPTRTQARKARDAQHVDGATLHIVRIHQDNTPDGRKGWAVEREDWNMSGVRTYLLNDGRWGGFGS